MEKGRPRRLFLTDEGLKESRAPLTARAVCSSLTVGKCAGNWVPFGGGHDQAGDQREDDLRSLVFETPPLDAPMEILGAAIITLEVACDRPIANLVVRLCDVHRSGESLRVSFGVLNLAHRDSHEHPAPMVGGQRYRVRIQLNDAGAVFPAGHKIRLAVSTAYWPMIWPAREKATVFIFAGTLDLPLRAPKETDARLAPFAEPETAPPEKPTINRRGAIRIERIERLGLELGTQSKTQFHVDEDDPLSAVADLSRILTMSRDAWQVRIETQLRLTSTRDDFLLYGSLQAWEGVERSLSSRMEQVHSQRLLIRDESTERPVRGRGWRQTGYVSLASAEGSWQPSDLRCPPPPRTAQELAVATRERALIARTRPRARQDQ